MICLFLLKVVHEIINWVLVRSGLSLRGFILCTAVKRIEGFFFFSFRQGASVSCYAQCTPSHVTGLPLLLARALEFVTWFVVRK